MRRALQAFPVKHFRINLLRDLFVIFSLLFFFLPDAFSQEFKIRSFKHDPHDISAIRYERKDVNGQLAAIIKVQTNLKGIHFECNTGFIGDIESKPGEFWMWVSPREKRLKFMKEGFLPKEYVIPEIVESGSVYLLELLGTGVSGPSGSGLGFILLKSDPSEAEVWLDGENSFRLTPFSKALYPGSYSVILKKEFYHDWQGTIDVSADSTTRQTISMIPDFGSLTLKSTPESGATVILDDDLLPDKTPLYLNKLSSGEHTIILKRELFRDTHGTFQIHSGENKVLTIPMKPSYGELLITMPTGAQLIIDKVLLPSPEDPIRLSAGDHLVEIQKDKHHLYSKAVTIIIGEQVVLEPLLQPITGKISIETDPPEARVYIDGVPQGTSPLFSEPLLIGTHQIRIEKEGYKTIQQSITVTEGKTIPLSKSLEKGFNDPRYQEDRNETSQKNPPNSNNNQTSRKEDPTTSGPKTRNNNDYASKSKQSRKKSKTPDTFNLGLVLTYAMPSNTFWEAEYNDVIRSFMGGYGFGVDIHYVWGNRFLGTGLGGNIHFFSTVAPENTKYYYKDPISLTTYSVWVEQLVYYLPYRDGFFSYIGGGIGYNNGSYSRYLEEEQKKLTTNEGILTARYGWGIPLKGGFRIEVSYQYNFIFSSSFDRLYGQLNIGIVW